MVYICQPLRLDIKRKLSARSDRVKCTDLHPSEPWMLVSLYNGNVHVWNHDLQVRHLHVKCQVICEIFASEIMLPGWFSIR